MRKLLPGEDLHCLLYNVRLYLFKIFVKFQEKGDVEVYPWIHRDFAVRAWVLALLRLLK